MCMRFFLIILRKCVGLQWHICVDIASAVDQVPRKNKTTALDAQRQEKLAHTNDSL